MVKTLKRVPRKSFTAVRQELLAICGNDEHQVMILSTLEFVTDKQAVHAMKEYGLTDFSQLAKEDLYVRLSFKDWEKRGISRRSFTSAIDKLEMRGFVERFVEEGTQQGQSIYYLLKYDVVDSAIEEARLRGMIADWSVVVTLNRSKSFESYTSMRERTKRFQKDSGYSDKGISYIQPKIIVQKDNEASTFEQSNLVQSDNEVAPANHQDIDNYRMSQYIEDMDVSENEALSDRTRSNDYYNEQILPRRSFRFKEFNRDNLIESDDRTKDNSNEKSDLGSDTGSSMDITNDPEASPQTSSSDIQKTRPSASSFDGASLPFGLKKKQKHLQLRN